MSKSKKSKHHHKKRRVVLSYFTNSITYVLLSLIIILPVSLLGFKYAQQLVHKAQQSYTISAADAVIDTSSFKASDVKSGKVQRADVKNCEMLGRLSCEQKGFYCNVFNGYNRASFREGAGLYTKFGMPGDNKKIYIGSYSTGGFKALENLEKGDKIRFETLWGEYEYKVSKIETAGEHSAPENKETLILTTQSSKLAFSAYNDKQLYVYADKQSGPEVEEVQK